MADQSASTQTKLDAATAKYAEGYEQFAKSKSGNLIVDFVMFRRNIVPHTLTILYVGGVLAAWLVAVVGIIGKGPVGQMCTRMVENKNGEMASSFDFIQALSMGIAIILTAPFILHYALEIVKFLWGFAIHIYRKVLIPLWETVVLRFFVGTLPKALPALLERSRKVLDILIAHIDPAVDAAIDGGIAIAMTVAATLKGIVWLPIKICRRLGRWLDKPLESER